MSDDAIHIRPMTPDDFGPVIELWRNCEGVGISADDAEAGFRSFIARNPGLSRVAEVSGMIAGAVLCGHDGRRGSMYHLAVHGEHRGRGIGRKLVDACLASLAEAGIYRCNAYVYGANANGLAFWTRIGWNARHDLVLVQRNTGG